MTAVSLLLAGWMAATPTLAAEAPEAVIYKNPECVCCKQYAAHLRENGFEVTVKDTHDLTVIKRMAGVPDQLAGCHTMGVGGYTVEGHVPVEVVNRLLSERPQIRGISLPGMPAGSPGMAGEKAGPFTIYQIADGEPAAEPKVYVVE